MDASIKSDSGHKTEIFCEDWVTHLDWEDRTSLGLFQLRSVLAKGETEAAELAAIMTDRTIREW